MTNEDARLRRREAGSDRAVQEVEGLLPPWRLNHSRYHSAAEIEAFMWSLADRYPRYVRLTVDPDHKSRQGRNLTIMTVESPNRMLKNSVWVDAGQCFIP